MRPSTSPTSKILSPGAVDLVASALGVHHVDAAAKRDLFGRVADVVRAGGRFVLADVFVPERAADAVTQLTPGFDRPDRLRDVLAWLGEAGFAPETTWSWKDLAVVRADLARTGKRQSQ